MKKPLLGALVAVAMAVGLMASPAAARDGNRHERGHAAHERSERHRDHDERWNRHKHQNGDDRWDRGERHDRRDRDDRRRGHDRDRGDRKDREDRSLSEGDVVFLNSSAQVALVEIIEGRLAMLRSGDPVVQEYGRTMMVDHFKQLYEQLKIHQKYDVPLPGLTEEQMSQLSDLAATSPEAFDATYLTVQVAGHEAALAIFTDAAEDADNRKVRKFAGSHVPTLYVHLEAARALLGTLPAPVA